MREDSSKPAPRWWDVCAVLLWLLLPLLKLQVHRAVLFDVVAMALLGWVLWERFWSVNVARRPGIWRPSAPRWFYLCQGGLVLAGFASGLHAVDAGKWAMETFIFLYLTLLLLVIDLFGSQHLERFIAIGAWVLTLVSGVCGFAVLLHFQVGYTIPWFFSNELSGSTRFSGTMRFCNQWAIFYCMLFPLMLVLVFRASSTWKRVLAAVCVALGLVAMPATGSRSGMFLVLAELAGFLVLYSVWERSVHTLRRLFWVGGCFALAVGLYGAIATQLTEFAIARRSMRSFSLIFEEGRVTDDWRMHNWWLALEAFGESPVFGLGLGNFVLYHDKHEVHSSPLSLLAETGLAGGGLYLVLCTFVLFWVVYAFVEQFRKGSTDLWLMALALSLGGAFVMSAYFNTTRQRFFWIVLLLALLYAIRALTKLAKNHRETLYQHTSRPLHPRPKYPRRTRAIPPNKR